jgi:hypothetical protein
LGHANRSWFHDAIGLDAQSRRLCLSFARRCESNTYTNGVAQCNAYGDSYGNSNSNPHGYCHSDTDTETYTQAYTVAEAASYAAAEAIGHS